MLIKFTKPLKKTFDEILARISHQQSFFAGRDTGHEAVIIYRSLRYLQMLGNEVAADKSVGPKGELFGKLEIMAIHKTKHALVG
ncbi:MAG: hypothetical protein ACI8ZB_004735 [Desulforhopalus sp.]|jgi:hypothetical protein